MENTLMIGVVSLLCIFAHVPSLLLRIVPFHEKISAKDKCRLTAIYLAGLAVDFGICMWMGINQVIDVPFYKVNLIVFCIVMAVVNVQIVRGYTKVHLFVFGIVADIVMITLAVGAYISSHLGMQGDAAGIAQTSVIAIIIYAVLYPLLRRLMRYTVTPFLEIDCKNYWDSIWFIPIALFFASIFSDSADVYTSTFGQMLSKCLIGAATILLCISIARDHQRFRNEEKDESTDRPAERLLPGTYRAGSCRKGSTPQFPPPGGGNQGLLDADDLQGLRDYCDNLELEQMGKVDIPYTGNAAADGVLYHYGCLAKAKNIDFSVCCHLKDLSIPDTDFLHHSGKCTGQRSNRSRVI